MRLCQLVAWRNREVMGRIIVQDLGLEVQDMFYTTHNYIDHDRTLYIRGHFGSLGEKLIIPVNMRDSCIFGSGKGNDDWNQSASHEAGCLMSRTQVSNELSLEEVGRQMSGIYSTTVGAGMFDESPMAYKGMESILDHIGSTVDVVDIPSIISRRRRILHALDGGFFVSFRQFARCCLVGGPGGVSSESDPR